ncbi:MAG: hypothetical protein ABWZ43_02955 [Solirubrobacterales bacterium]
MAPDGRPGAAAADRRVALAAAVAAVCGIGVLLATVLAWYGVANAIRIGGGTVEVEVTMWGIDDGSDLLLVAALVAGIVISGLTVAVRLTARPTRAAWALGLAATVGFALALLLIVARVTDPPGPEGVDLRVGAIAGLILAVLATAASAIAARLGREPA